MDTTVSWFEMSVGDQISNVGSNAYHTTEETLIRYYDAFLYQPG